MGFRSLEKTGFAEQARLVEAQVEAIVHAPTAPGALGDLFARIMAWIRLFRLWSVEEAWGNTNAPRVRGAVPAWFHPRPGL
jgi:hypothetical protein